MENITTLIIVSAIAALTSICGGFLFLAKSKLVPTIKKFGPYLSAALLSYLVLATLLPIAAELMTLWQVLILTIASCLLFFMAGRFVGRYREHGDVRKFKTTTQAILTISIDSMRTLANGLAIGIAFAVNLGVGIAVAAAVVAHELPQEIEDFEIMKRSKFPVRKILLIQILTTLLMVPVAIIAFLLVTQHFSAFTPFMLAIVAGFFINAVIGEIAQIIEEIRKK